MKTRRQIQPIFSISALIALAAQPVYAEPASTPDASSTIAPLPMAGASRQADVGSLGFLPRNALNTLEALGQLSLDGFAGDGAITIPQSSIRDVLLAAARDELRMEIFEKDDEAQTFLVRFREKQRKFSELNFSQADAIRELSRRLKILCDMSAALAR